MNCQEKQELYLEIKSDIVNIRQLFPNISTAFPPRGEKRERIIQALRDTNKLIVSVRERMKKVTSLFDISEYPGAIEVEIPAGYKTADQYEKELEEKGFTLGSLGKHILHKADLKKGSDVSTKIVILTLNSLGFPNGATREQIQAATRKIGIGLRPLPARVGPELRLQYENKLIGKVIAIDMEKINGPNGHSFLFHLSDGGGVRWLDAFSMGLDTEWIGADRWAFSQD